MKTIICAIPVYNEGKILRAYLDGLLNQSVMPGWEIKIIVANNNSTDDTQAILDEYNIENIFVKEKGVSIARRKLQEYIINNYFSEEDYYLSLDCEPTPYKDGFINKFIKASCEGYVKLVLGDTGNWDYDVVSEATKARKEVNDMHGIIEGEIMCACFYMIALPLLKGNLIQERIIFEDDNIRYDTIDDVIYILQFLNPYNKNRLKSYNQMNYVDLTGYMSARITDDKLTSKEYYNNDSKKLSINEIKHNLVYAYVIYYFILNMFIFPNKTIYSCIEKDQAVEDTVNYISKEYLFKQKFITYEYYVMSAVIIWHLHRDWFIKILLPVCNYIDKIKLLNDKETNNIIKVCKENNLTNEQIVDILWDNYFIDYSSITKFMVDYV